MLKPSFFIILLCLCCSLGAVAQDFEVPALPSTKEEFVNSEKDLIGAAKWLETTPIGTQMDKRKLVNAYVVAWVINSPTVTVNARSSILKLFDKNTELNAVYLAAYSRYVLENNYSKDELKANTAAIKAVINCYNLGGEVKKNKLLTQVIEKDKEGKLEEWVSNAMK